MEALTYDYDEKPATARRSSDALWNLLTVIALLGVACVVAAFWMIFSNPYSAFNPFPPPTLPVALELPTQTPTPPGQLPPTWTPTATVEPTATETPYPTSTLAPTNTPFSLVTPTAEVPASTPTKPAGGYPFVLKNGGPIAIPNIAYPSLGCEWMGVGGQVFDMSGGPKTQVIVILGGSLAGHSVNPMGTLTSLTGVATQYGQAGFEFKLADYPTASEGSLWIQLVDQANIPLSEKVYFDTYQDCEKNLVLINFNQVK